jgi:hypothetical protein
MNLEQQVRSRGRKQRASPQRLLADKLRQTVKPAPPKTLRERVWDLECEMSMVRDFLCEHMARGKKRR